MLNQEKKQELEIQAREIRKDIVTMIGVGKAGHLGGSCSLADIVTVLYFYKMRHNPAEPGWKERDRFLLSKGPVSYTHLDVYKRQGKFCMTTETARLIWWAILLTARQ